MPPFNRDVIDQRARNGARPPIRMQIGNLTDANAMFRTETYAGGAAVFDALEAWFGEEAITLQERLLGLSLTPWSQRQLDIRLKGKAAGKEARAKAGAERVAGTKPAHPLEAYVGEYDHPAYGVLGIEPAGEGLRFSFHKIRLPLSHFHYERFDTPDDEQDGKWSVNFVTCPQGEVDRAVMSLDQAEATFTRRVAAALSARETLARYAGTYETPTGVKFLSRLALPSLATFSAIIIWSHLKC